MASPVRNPAVRRGDVERRAAGPPGGRGAQRGTRAAGARFDASLDRQWVNVSPGQMLEATDPPGLAALWVWRGSFRND